MSFAGGLGLLQPSTSDNKPHYLGHSTARTAANDLLYDLWNGATNAARVFSLDLNGKLYSAAATAGDILYAVTGGVTSVRRLDSLAIGTAGQVLHVNAGATAPEWTSTLAGLTSVTSTAFVGDLTGDVVGNVTGNASGSSGSCTGNAATATALATARAINGVDFNGTAAITVTAAAGTLSGATLAAGVTASSLTSVGTLTALQVDNLNINGNTILATTGAVNITPATGSAILLDGTISVDAGVVTGATSITSTAFVGALTGNASGSSGSCTGNAATATAVAASGITGTTLASNVVTSSLTTIGTLVAGAVPAARVTAGTFGAGAYVFNSTVSGITTLTATTLAGTLSTAAQANVTSLGTLTALQVDNLNVNGNTISSTAGTDLNITPLAGQQIVLDGTIVIDAGVVTGATSITSTVLQSGMGSSATTVPSGGVFDTLEDSTGVGNVGAGEDTLWTYTLPANVFSANGKVVRITFGGTLAGNVNLKQLKVYAGVGSYTFVATVTASHTGFFGQATIIRSDATHVLLAGSAQIVNDTASHVSTPISIVVDPTGTIDVKITGEGVDTNDLLLKVVTAEFLN